MKMVTGRFGTPSIDSSSAADHKRLSDMVFQDREDMEWLENDMDVYVAPEAVFSCDGEYLPGPFPTRYSGSEVSSLPRKVAWWEEPITGISTTLGNHGNQRSMKTWRILGDLQDDSEHHRRRICARPVQKA